MFLINNDEKRQKSVAVTESFISKYDGINNAIISQTNENGACYGYKSNDFKYKIAECYWYAKSGDKVVKVKFILDDREYIDDIEVLNIELLKK